MNIQTTVDIAAHQYSTGQSRAVAFEAKIELRYMGKMLQVVRTEVVSGLAETIYVNVEFRTAAMREELEEYVSRFKGEV